MKKMKKCFVCLVTAIMMVTTLKAQQADKKAHEEMATQVKDYFNAKEFSKIYGLTSSDFKSSIKEKDLTDMLERGMFNSLGRITSWNLLREDTAGYYVFVLNYDKSKVQMNMGLNSNNEIALFQFIPYREKTVSKIKRKEYASDNRKLSGLDSLIEKTLAGYMQSPENCGISIGVTVNGKNYFYNYGEVKRGSAALPSSGTIYEIGSVSKTFCGTLLAYAVSENKLSLDDDIRKYLPGNYPYLTLNKKPILVKHLANHTSGLQRLPDDIESQLEFNVKDPYKNYSKEMMYAFLKRTRPDVEPGSAFNYSNFGMALLGLVLENVYNKSFEALVKEKIALPNKMDNTSIALNSQQQGSFAEGYNEKGEATPHWNLGNMAAAGGLRSSTADMLTYLNYQMGEKDGATQLAHTSTFAGGRENLALAWFLKSTKQGNTLVWHNGGTFGFSSFVGFIKEKKCSLTVLANSGTNVDFIGIAILDYLQR